MLPAATSNSGAGSRGAMTPVLWLVLLLTAARLLYLFFFCPYTLIEDEAHYWDWSRHLGPSYYSKGPGIAWTIAASTAILGDTEIGVRFFAPVFSGLATLAVAGLARAVSRDRRLPLLAAACFQLIPAYQFTSLILTIDMPYVACWCIAALCGWYAIERRRAWAWPALGAALGLAFLYKYTVLLLPPGLLLYALLRRGSRPGRLLPGSLVAAAVFAVFTLPILLWNQQHGWATVHHLLGHLGIAGGDMPLAPAAAREPYSPLWTLEYLGAQFGLIGPVLILMLMSVIRARRERDAADLYPFLCAGPIILFYLLVSLFNEGEGNWAIAGYTTLVIPAARLALEALDARRASPFSRSRPARRVWRIAVVWGLATAVLMLRLDWLAALPGLGPRIPTGRLMHADDRARELAALADDLAARTGQTPFYLAQHYGRASQLAFYLPGRPRVYCSSKLMGGRATQYDLWPFTDLTNPETHARLAGRPAIMSGGEPYQWQPCFEQIRDLGPLPSESKRGRRAYEGVGYLGFGRDGPSP